MNITECYVSVFVFIWALLVWTWSKHMGVVRGVCAGVVRLLWIVPILTAFYPHKIVKEVARPISKKNISILVDDSESMKPHLGEVKKFLQHIKKRCSIRGCSAQETMLSEKSDLVHMGYSPLSLVLYPWLRHIHFEPWIFITDGEDFKPQTPWFSKQNSADGFGVGLVATVSAPDMHNMWLDSIEFPGFGFEGKPITGQVKMSRSKDHLPYEVIQLHAMLEDHILATTNVEFLEGVETTWGEMALPTLKRGTHGVEFRILPKPHESSIWDNHMFHTIEVMPNTLGVLHLLGNPSWDGRFLRRYLKAEPKYDLISFYILRDPHDSQQVNEREMSLIPFPVSKLFQEELLNFRVIVIQDFTLLQFLLPQYQKNLVEFVKQGGGLLFIGGKRSLKPQDMLHSPLKDILPFEVPDGLTPSNPRPDSDALLMLGEDREPSSQETWFAEQQPFTVELAKPTLHQRQMATFFDEWESLAIPLQSFQNGIGLHHTEQVLFKKDTTPLLEAKLPHGTTAPLAVASYPAKGRAIWIFTDSLWRLALTPHKDIARDVYHRLMESAMTWLMKEDLQKPLVITEFSLHSRVESSASPSIEFRAKLEGAAVRYLQLDDGWRFFLCGQELTVHTLAIDSEGEEHKWLTGSLLTALKPGGKCSLKIQGANKAFGSLVAQSSTFLPLQLKDHELKGSFKKLKDLVDVTKADFLDLTLTHPSFEDGVEHWLDKFMTDTTLTPSPPEYTWAQDHYWLLAYPYLWLLFLCIPVEVYLRRLQGRSPRGRSLKYIPFQEDSKNETTS